MTPEQLQQDRKTIDAATPPPWIADLSPSYGPIGVNTSTEGQICITGYDDCYRTDTEREKEDMEFIAAARDRWPAALDEIERLKKELDAATTDVDGHCARCGRVRCGP